MERPVEATAAKSVNCGCTGGINAIDSSIWFRIHIGFDSSGNVVDRFVCQYMDADTLLLKLQVGELSTPDVAGPLCTTPMGWSTETLSAVSLVPSGGQQFWPTLNWTDRSSAPLAAFAERSREWQLGYLSNHRSVDSSKSYVGPYGSTVGMLADQPALSPRIPLIGNAENTFLTDDSFPCVRQSGYWGDYFGVTQFPRAVPISFFFPTGTTWTNAATFTFSGHRPKGAGPICDVYDGLTLGAPMDVHGAIWVGL